MLGLEVSQCSQSVKPEIHHFKLGLTSTVSVATFQCMHMQETCRVIAACIILCTGHMHGRYAVQNSPTECRIDTPTSYIIV